MCDRKNHPRRINCLNALLLTTAVFATACAEGESPLSPEDVGSPQDGLTAAISLPTLVERAAASGSVRIEVEVQPDGPPWIASEIEAEGDGDQLDEEEIEGRIIAADEVMGTLTIRFGELTIDLSADAEFRIEGSGEVTREEFFERVASELAAGHEPGVELSRDPPNEPQAPDDASFEADDVRLDDDAEVGELELNVTEANFDVTGESTGTVTLLGVEILLDANQGTEIEAANDEGTGAVEIEGLAATVSEADRSVTLMDGRTVRLVDGTRIKDGGHDDHLSSLAEVANALADGKIVEVEAKAVLETAGEYIAIKIEFEVEDDDDDLPGAEEFEDHVVSADPAAGTFTLASGLVLSVTDVTVIDDDGDLLSLEAVAEALAAELVVEAEGNFVKDVQAPSGWAAIHVEFETDD